MRLFSLGSHGNMVAQDNPYVELSGTPGLTKCYSASFIQRLELRQRKGLPGKDPVPISTFRGEIPPKTLEHLFFTKLGFNEPRLSNVATDMWDRNTRCSWLVDCVAATLAELRWSGMVSIHDLSSHRIDIHVTTPVPMCWIKVGDQLAEALTKALDR